MGKGFFITFEGGEGAGKSTQLSRLEARLREAGHEVVVSREPGGTETAERIRGLLVSGDPGAMSSTAEALLNYAARDDHLRRLIRPALEEGKVVLCDRFMDSTRAYQGYAGDCPIALVEALEREVVGETRPDLTIIFDIDPATGLGRAGARERSNGGGEDRFERFGMEFHRRLREAFLRIAREEPERCVVVDAARPADEVEREIAAAVAARMPA